MGDESCHITIINYTFLSTDRCAAAFERPKHILLLNKVCSHYYW